MSPSDSIGLAWPDLVSRLSVRDCLNVWGVAEPVLRRFSEVSSLADTVRDIGNPAQSNAVLAALVRCAATDGGDDRDAALLVAHLLANGSRALAIKLRDLSPDIDALVAGALWIQIRSFPWKRRRRAIAQNLLLDTRRAVLRELCPNRRKDGSRWLSSADPVDLERIGGGAPPTFGEDLVEDRAAADLVDLLTWALGREVIRQYDVQLLLDLVAASRLADDRGVVCRRGLNVASEVGHVASQWQVDEKTVRRRRDRALRALREAKDAYLSDVA
jgi:hypothetical protein